MVTKYESRVNPRTGKASLIKVEKPLTRQQQAMKIQREQRAAAPKPKGTLLSVTTGGVERKVEAGKIVPEKSTLLQAPAFAEAVTVEAEAEPKAISAGEAGLIKAYEAGQITKEQYERSRASMGLDVAEPIVTEPTKETAARTPTPEDATKFVSDPELFSLAYQYEYGLIDKEEYEKKYKEIATSDSAPMVRRSEEVYAEKLVEPAADEVEIPVIGEEFLTPEAINLAIIGRESGIAEEGYVFDLSSPTGFREEETGQVVPMTVAAPALISEDLLERAAKEKELSVIRQERDLLVDAAIQDMLTTGRLQTRGQAATVQFLRRPGSRQLAEDLLGFYGLFI